MSGVGPVGGALNNIASRPQGKIENKADKTQADPKDKVEIKKEKEDISLPRKVFEKVVGAPAGLVTLAGNAVGGILGGGVSGVEKDADDADTPHAIGTGLAYMGMGAAAGTMTFGVIGGIVGGVVGLGFAIMSGASGSLEKVSHKVGAKAEKATMDNSPSESKIKDSVMNFTEGGIVGGIYGGIEGFKQGNAVGSGLVSGAIEGTKGFVGALAGTHETKEARENKTDESFVKRLGKAILRAPRNTLKLIAGTATGAVGGALGIADGLIQGTVVGIDHGEHADDGAHNVIYGVELALAGGVAGFAVGGPWGAAIGTGAGIVAGLVHGKIANYTESDERAAEGITKAVRHAAEDNVYSGKVDQYGDRERTVYESFRDGIEGTLTGTGAGIREGAKEGYGYGAGVVDGVFDAAKGIAKGVVGGVTGLGKKAAPKAEKE